MNLSKKNLAKPVRTITPDYEKIIADYQKDRKPDYWIDHCSSQSGFHETIMAAALGKDGKGRKNKHQWRINNDLLERFGELLCAHAKELKKAGSFAQLLEAIERYKFTGIGPLACYDTATRIGAVLGLFPEKIYLHAGTRIGAQKVLGTKLTAQFIEKTDLPKAFQSESLTHNDIENLLCICRHSFDGHVGT